jgi:hypothetical protein
LQRLRLSKERFDTHININHNKKTLLLETERNSKPILINQKFESVRLSVFPPRSFDSMICGLYRGLCGSCDYVDCEDRKL